MVEVRAGGTDPARQNFSRVNYSEELAMAYLSRDPYGNRTPNLIPNSLVQLFGSTALNCSTAGMPRTVNVTLAGLVVESSTPQ